MNKMLRLFATLLAMTVMFSAANAQSCKNVILMISDGCGYNQIKATDQYWGSTQPYEHFPVQLAMSTYSWTTTADPSHTIGYDVTRAWSEFGYLLLRPTDSASAATAMSTGVKNRDNELNVDPLTRARLFTIQEKAHQMGKSTGVITTVEWSHATPAGFAAHNVSRNNYSQIAVEMLDSTGLDVIMGAGHPDYTDNNTLAASHNYSYVGGQAKWNQLVNHTTPGGWTLIQDRSEFQALQTGSTPDRVCGTFKCATTSQEARTPGEGYNSPVAPFSIPMNDVPSLAEMSRGAINVLDNNANGFFLMIEGGAIDWAGHANQHGRLIEEETDFNNAVNAVIAWVNANSNWDETMLIVTGDHETGYLWGPTPNAFNELGDNGSGNLPSMWFNSTNHSNSLIPIFAKGAGTDWLNTVATGSDLVRGRFIDNTDVARLMFGCYDHTLAVELNSFEAIAENDHVSLRWSTASETDNARFEISRDGSVVATLDSKGNTASGNRYSWTDADVRSGSAYNYTLTAIDLSGQREELARRSVVMSASGSSVVSQYTLFQNYPNPFNPSTQIGFDLPQSGNVELAIYNPIGQKVATLVSGTSAVGHHTVSFDGAKLAAGIYYYSITADGFHATKKMLLLK